VIFVLMDEDASKSQGASKIGLVTEASGKLFVKDVCLKKLPR
jgi:hypothetical protein